MVLIAMLCSVVMVHLRRVTGGGQRRELVCPWVEQIDAGVSYLVGSLLSGVNKQNI